jgi:type VII secretion protein EccB
VNDTDLTSIPLGQMTGIPDGPTVLPEPGQAPTTWAVCDQIPRDPNAQTQTGHKAPTTTVLVGETNIGKNLQANQALLVSSDGGQTLYLVYGLAGNINLPNDSAVRAQVDANDPAVLQTFGITDKSTYRVVSPAVLNAIPSVSEIQDPATGLSSGQQPIQALASAGLTMGESFQVQQVGQASRYYIVVPGGMQLVSATTAQIAIFENSNGLNNVPTVRPDVIDNVPTVTNGLHVNVANYPSVVPTVISADTRPVMCLGWQANLSDPQKPLAKTRVTVDFNLEVPSDPSNPSGRMSMVPIGTGTASGKINAFFMNPSLGGAAVRAATNPGEFSNGPIYIVDPRGLAFSVPDTYTAQVLGIADSSANGGLPPAPQSILGLLPPGGSPLDTQAVQHTVDGMPMPKGVGQFIQPAQQGSGG